MSIFNRIVASIGIGSARVDTKLRNSSFTQGEVLTGVVEITGGVTNQMINSIQLNLKTIYGYEGSDRLSTAVIYSHHLSDTFTISKGQRREIPFSFMIPFDTPITMRDSKTFQNVPLVWIETDLDLKNAADTSDQDYISIDPTEVYGNILEAVKIIGFKFRQMESQSVPPGIVTKRPFVQQFEFTPLFGKYVNKLDELEVYILQGESETTIYFEIDKKTKGAFSSVVEKLNLDEHRTKHVFNNEDILKRRNYISDQIEEMLNKYL